MAVAETTFGVETGQLWAILLGQERKTISISYNKRSIVLAE
jgi:hypothetical protein